MTRKRTRPRDRITQASCLLITALLIVSAVSAGVGTGMASAEPAGMVSVPDQNITEDIPADALVPLGASQLHDGRILTDSHAMSLDVILTTPARAGEITGTDTASLTGDMALILRDTEHSAGRRVAIDAGLLQTALGYEPQAIYGTHENGEQWTATAKYVDGYLVFDVPHFSTNTVTFSGEVSIDAQDVTSGTQFSYALADGVNPSNPTLTITGKGTTQNKSHSFSSPGVKSVSVGGSSVDNAEIQASALSESNVYVGEKVTRFDTGDVDNDGTSEIVYETPNGYINYYDPYTTASTFVNHQPHSVSTGDVDNDGTSEIIYRSANGNNLKYYDTSSNTAIDTGEYAYGSPQAADVDNDGTSEIVYRTPNDHLQYYDAVTNTNTGTGQDAGFVAPGDVDSDGTPEIVYIDLYDNIKFYDAVSDTYTSTGGSGYRLATGDIDADEGAEVVYRDSSDNIDYYDYDTGDNINTGGDGYQFDTGDIDADGTNEIVYRDTTADNLKYYDTASNTHTDTGLTTKMSPTIDDVDNNGVDEIVYANDNDYLRYYSLGSSIDVTVDVNNDNTDETTLTVSEGSTNSVSLPSLTPGVDTVEISANGPMASATLSYTEITRASNPEITISSESATQTITHTGTLAGGEQIDLSDDVNMSKISGNTNINVNLDTGKINLAYSHTAQNQISTIYDASTFEESYNIHYTYADATENAEITVPFASQRVIGVKRFEYRINGGEWHSVASANRRFSNATATAYLSQSNGGPLPAGATVEVRATGRKVNVENGEVAITDPTKPGEPLDTQLKIESRSADFSLNVGPTDDGDRIHYAYSNAYPTQDYVVIDGAGNQRLYLPESQPGDTFRMKHVRTKANVVAGDAKIRVVDPDDKKFEIMPGPGGDGDTVELTYYGAQSGNTYMLESLTREIILDTQTANSPVTFVDDDSHEMWRILLESGGSGDTGGGGGLIGVASGAASNAGSAVSGLLPAISVPALGGIGGVGSAGFALALAGAVAVLVYGNVFGRIAGVIASLNPFGGTPASGGGADTGNGGIDTSGVTSALSGVVTRAGRVGGTAGVRVLRATTQLLTTSTRIIGRESARLARYLAANPSVALGLGGVGVAVAAYQGLVQLTPQATTAILIGSGGLVTYLVLQRTGTFSWLSFGLIFGAFVILGAGAINPDVLASFGASLQDILPLLVIVGAYVVYRILQTRSQDASTPDTIVRFTGGGSGSDDNNN